MTQGEIWKDFFKKTVLTVLIAGVLFYWATLVFTKDGATNYFYVWLCCGIPFGIAACSCSCVAGMESHAPPGAPVSKRLRLSIKIENCSLIHSLLSVRFYRGFGILPNKQNPHSARSVRTGILRKGYPFPMLAA